MPGSFGTSSNHTGAFASTNVSDKFGVFGSNEATARTHAKHILAKTGTTRQTELIRRFFETSLPGSPNSA